MSPERLCLVNKWALGDSVCLTALVRDIHLAHPGRFVLELRGHYKGIWKHCPDITATESPKGRSIQLDYREVGIKTAGHVRGQKTHFLARFHDSFHDLTGFTVPVTEPKGVLYLPPGHKFKKPADRYWVVLAGGKSDMTAKVWHASRWQQMIDSLAACGITCVQAGADHVRHFHPRLRNCISVLGRTDSEFDFFSLIQQSDGVICGVTAAMHIAAVYDKPCVVLAGGREEPWWENYGNSYGPTFGPTCAPVKVPHKFLHTVGVLDCGIGNLTKGCWRSKVVPITREDMTHPESIRKICKKPIRGNGQAVPECLDRITAIQVVENVLDYYRDGTLQDVAVRQDCQPLTQPTRMELDLVSTFPREITAKPSHGPDFSPVDHPYLGGRITIFVLGFGEHVDLMRRCLTSILSTVPRERRDIRVALNQPSSALQQYVEALHPLDVSKIYTDHGDRRKYPAMRQMFWDPEHPITTKYLCWFDDDSWCHDQDWLPQLATCIAGNHGTGCRLYGTRFIHDLMIYAKNGHNPRKWFEAATWWKDQWLYTAKGAKTSPNGSQIVFATGGFWALDVEAMRLADIPDVRLRHNGGDCTIGSQIQQASFRVKDFSRGKKPIRWSDSPRRGWVEPFPWSPSAR